MNLAIRVLPEPVLQQINGQALKPIGQSFLPLPQIQEQLEMDCVFDQVNRRYRGFTRSILIELDRSAVNAIANMVQAHKADQFFYSGAGDGFAALERIVREWVDQNRKANHG